MTKTRLQQEIEKTTQDPYRGVRRPNAKSTLGTVIKEAVYASKNIVIVLVVADGLFSLYARQVRVTVGDSGLCSCIRVMYLERSLVC